MIFRQLYEFFTNKTYDYAYCDLILVNFSKNLKQIKKQKLNGIFSVFRYPVGSGTIFKKNYGNWLVVLMSRFITKMIMIFG